VQSVRVQASGAGDYVPPPEVAEFLSTKNFGWRVEFFHAAASYLIDLKRPVTIVETGCMRPPYEEGKEWADGQSTLVWDFIVNQTGGGCVSIDINPENVKYARSCVSDRTTVIEKDSIQLLAGMKCENKIDLLYLDSMDFKPESALESTLHHIGELAAIWNQLAPGAIVAVDDCIGPYVGKHAMVKVLFEWFAGIQPLQIGYVTAWRLPDAVHQ
jgi:hypothetical protein